MLALNNLDLDYSFYGLSLNYKNNFQSTLTSYVHEKMLNKNQLMSDSKNIFGLKNKQYRPENSKNIIQVSIELNILYYNSN